MAALPESAAAFLAAQADRLRRLKPKRRIVFPEGDDPRVQAAAERLEREGLLTPVLLKSAERVAGAEARKYGKMYFERRRAKGVTEVEAEEIARRPLYRAALMVAAGDAHGFVGGAVRTTAEVVRAALHCIGLAPSASIVSSAFLMAVPDRTFGHNGLIVFADCGIVVDPSAVELAEIAIATAATTRNVIGAEPRVALLSFSTKASAEHEWVDKVVEALRIVHERAPDLAIDGELQGDAALVEAVARVKAPGSSVAGRANTLIFPDLTSGNICYKLVERLAGVLIVRSLAARPGETRQRSFSRLLARRYLWRRHSDRARIRACFRLS